MEKLRKRVCVIYIFINFDFSKKYIKFRNLLVFIYNDIVLSHVALTDNLLQNHTFKNIYLKLLFNLINNDIHNSNIVIYFVQRLIIIYDSMFLNLS